MSSSTDLITTIHSNIKRSPWESERASFFFWIVPFIACCLHVCMVNIVCYKAVKCTMAVDKWFAMHPSVFIGFLVHLYLFFAFIVRIHLSCYWDIKYEIKWREYTNFITNACKKSLGSSYFGAWADFHWNHLRSFDSKDGTRRGRKCPIQFGNTDLRDRYMCWHYRIICKHNALNIISREVQGCISTNFDQNNFATKILGNFECFYL